MRPRLTAGQELNEAMGGGALGLRLGTMAFVSHVHLPDADAGMPGGFVEGGHMWHGSPFRCATLAFRVAA